MQTRAGCGANTDDFLCSSPEVWVKGCTFWHFLLLISELLTTLTETEIPFSHVYSEFYLENIQLPHQEGVPGWKEWMLKFELISALSAAASAMPGHALPCRTCVLHSRSFHKCEVPDFLNGDVDI